jgi:hypothetical protein
MILTAEMARQLLREGGFSRAGEMIGATIDRLDEQIRNASAEGIDWLTFNHASRLMVRTVLDHYRAAGFEVYETAGETPGIRIKW